MRTHRAGVVGAVLLALALVATACGSGDDTDSAGEGGGNQDTITVASFNFPESEILAHIYAEVLRSGGYDVNVRAKLGNRELVLPALEEGEVDMVPEYVGTLLEALAKPASEATADREASLEKLRKRLEEKELTALEPAEAFNANAIVVTKETAEANKLTKVSDLAAVDDKLTFGGPPECPQRPLCLLGLREKYGLEFKKVEQLDAGGPITREALKAKRIDVALLFSSDGAISKEGWVVLEDDKGLQPAENIVPVIRTEKLTDEIEELLNKASAALSSERLIELNAMVDIEKEDPVDAAKKFVEDEGLAE
jgi:osmoprotectant transport system substrate-binding protein